MKMQVAGSMLPVEFVDRIVQAPQAPDFEACKGVTYDAFLQLLGWWVEAELRRQVLQMRRELGLDTTP